MFYVMCLTILLGALTHIHGAFAFALVPCVGLLACYAYTALYGDWTHEGTYDGLYVRVKVSDTPFYIVDRHGRKRVHWIEVGTNEQRGKKQFTFTVGCFTFQVGFKKLEYEFCTPKSETFTHNVKRPMKPEEVAAMREGFGHFDKAFDAFGKIWGRDGK